MNSSVTSNKSKKLTKSSSPVVKVKKSVTNSIPNLAKTKDAGAGSEIRMLRRAQSLSLENLAEASGCSVAHLSQIERGIGQPSLPTLQRVAQALGVHVGWFFPAGDGVDQIEQGVVLRKSARRRLESSPGVWNDLLSPNLEGPVSLLLTTVESGKKSGEAYCHTGHECGVVLEGSLDLWIEGKLLHLQSGDAFSFSSSSLHWFSNPGQDDCKVLWVLYPPNLQLTR